MALNTSVIFTGGAGFISFGKRTCFCALGFAWTKGFGGSLIRNSKYANVLRVNIENMKLQFVFLFHKLLVFAFPSNCFVAWCVARRFVAKKNIYNLFILFKINAWKCLSSDWEVARKLKAFEVTLILFFKIDHKIFTCYLHLFS